MTADELRALDSAACKAVGIEQWGIQEQGPFDEWEFGPYEDFDTKPEAEAEAEALADLYSGVYRVVPIIPEVTTNHAASARLVERMEVKGVYPVALPIGEKWQALLIRSYVLICRDEAAEIRDLGENVEIAGQNLLAPLIPTNVPVRERICETRLIAIAKAAVAWKETR